MTKNLLEGWLIVGGGDKQSKYFASVSVGERSSNLGTFPSFPEAQEATENWQRRRKAAFNEPEPKEISNEEPAAARAPITGFASFGHPW